MLAADAPVWVARDRAAGAEAAARAGAEVIVMDDGHQNPRVRKRLSLVVVDGETRDGEWPFGDGAVFPAGPMREPLAAGLARADAVVLLLPADLAAPDPALAGGPGGEAGAGRAPRARRAAARRAAARLRRHRQALEDGAGAEGRRLRPRRLRPATRPRPLRRAPARFPRPPRRGARARRCSPARRTGCACRPPGASASAAWPVEARFEDEAALDALLAPLAFSLPAG